MRLNHQDLKKIERKLKENHEAQFPELGVLISQKSLFCHNGIQNGKDEIQIHAFNIINDSVSHSSQ